MFQSFPKSMAKKILKQIMNKRTSTDSATTTPDSKTSIWFRLPYYGDICLKLANS